MYILFEVLKSIFPIFVIILIGYLMQRYHWFDDSFAGNISKLIMKIALPASIFSSVIHYLKASQLVAFADGIIIGGLAVVISYLVAFLLVKLCKIRAGRRGLFINAFANANTIFIGMPLNLALFGPNAEKYFLIYYVINTISTWAFGSFLITSDPLDKNQTSKSHDHKGVWKQVLSPPLLAFLFAIVLVLIQIKVPSPITTTTQYLGNLVTPLALIYIGIVLCNAGIRSLCFDRDTVVALLGKFVIAPAAMILIIISLMHTGITLPKLESSTLIMQSAVPALTVLPVLANEGKGDVRYATNIVALSTILFVIVAPIIMMIIHIL